LFRPTLAAAAVVLALLAVAGCGPRPAPLLASIEVDPAAAAMIARYGHRSTGPTRRAAVEIADLRGQPWALYLEASRAVGLDFSALEGETGELLITPIAASESDAVLVVLLVGGQPAGAWIGPGGTTSGVLPLDARP
jgi:hypothetical protein